MDPVHDKAREWLQEWLFSHPPFPNRRRKRVRTPIYGSPSTSRPQARRHVAALIVGINGVSLFPVFGPAWPAKTFGFLWGLAKGRESARKAMRREFAEATGRDLADFRHIIRVRTNSELEDYSVLDTASVLMMPGVPFPRNALPTNCENLVRLVLDLEGDREIRFPVEIEHMYSTRYKRKKLPWQTASMCA